MELISCFKIRLKEAIEYRRITHAELSRATGISLSLLGKYIKGVSEAGNVKLKLLSDALNVSPVWLMGYDVPMKEEEEEINLDETITISKESYLHSFVMMYISLDDSQKELIKNMMDQMAKK